MGLPQDYTERVYAGVLGKIIGVYLGRPFEGWTYERIMRELGEIEYYVHDRLGAPLVVTDDDISGTFTFLRALPDHGFSRDITPAQIGQTWLNYIIERRTILWWGGMGNSTEHTAFLRLKRGVEAPRSGSATLNGRIVAEQIGAQIFIDGWGMVAPGDPEFAADLARRAASVSHDGAAIHGAQVIAAMEAQAFVEPDLDTLLDTALALIPRRSIIARLIGDVREWRAQYPDWRDARALIEQHYGYEIYGGNCHMVPNHALIMLGLLYGDDDLQRSLMITNTAGWDTDCNSGNVGCVLGIKNGLAGIDSGPDWRTSVADRLYLPTADGGRAITDAVRETYEVVNAGRALHQEEPLAPKHGARFHWELPGSVQGWRVEGGSDTVENVEGHSEHGTRSLAVRLTGEGETRIATPTFVPPDAIAMPGYTLLASPTLYPGQTVRIRMEADAANPAAVDARLFIDMYGIDDELERRDGERVMLAPGASHRWTWRVPSTGGMPIAAIGVELARATRESVVYLDELGWDGAPDVRFERPLHGGTMWRRAWVNGAHYEGGSGSETYRVIQDEGTGLFMQGTREWRDYTLRALVRPHMARRAGIAVRVGGMRRWYGLLLGANKRVRLVKALDGERVLAEAPFTWSMGQTYALELTVRGTDLVARIDGQDVLHATDDAHPLQGGGIALVVDEGRLDVDDVAVSPSTER
jgi:ADP-ribosylglycohydrolase